MLGGKIRRGGGSLARKSSPYVEASVSVTGSVDWYIRSNAAAKWQHVYPRAGICEPPTGICHPCAGWMRAQRPQTLGSHSAGAGIRCHVWRNGFWYSIPVYAGCGESLWTFWRNSPVMSLMTPPFVCWADDGVVILSSLTLPIPSFRAQEGDAFQCRFSFVSIEFLRFYAGLFFNLNSDCWLIRRLSSGAI